MAKIEIIFPSSSMLPGNINHNDLSGLEGLGPEYIHLNQEEYDNLDDILSNTLVTSVNGEIGDIILDYNDVGAAPTIHTHTISQITNLQSTLDNKQNTLVSGTNIKTIEGQSLLGSGNIDLNKTDVGLSNVDDTSDINKPISTTQQTALNLKADLISPIFTGDPKAPTPAPGDNDTSVATTAFVNTAISNSINPNAILQGGNSFGTAMNIGTIDNFNFTLKTNNTDRLIINNVGVNIPLGLTINNSLFLFGGQIRSSNASITAIGLGADTSAMSFLKGVTTSSAYAFGVGTGSTGDLMKYIVGGGTTIGGVRVDGRTYGADAISTNDFVTLSQLTSSTSAVIAQTITDGITTSAPSQDVVYDALALKADRLEIIPQSYLINDDVAVNVPSINDGAYNAFPQMFQFNDNEILLHYSKGIGHIDYNSKRVGRISKDGGKTYGAEFTINYQPGYAVNNVTTFVTKTNRFIVLYVPANASGPISNNILIKYSDDKGQTYNTPIQIPFPSGMASVFGYGKGLYVAGEKIVLGFYGIASNGNYRNYTITSSDNGVTWSTPSLVSDTPNTAQYTEASYGYCAGGSIIGIIRNDLINTKFLQVRSDDNGTTWSTTGIVTFGTQSSASPEIAPYYEVNGDLYFSLWYVNRNVPRDLKCIVAKVDDLLANGVSAWRSDKILSFGAHAFPSFDFGYPTVINPHKKNRFLIASYLNEDTTGYPNTGVAYIRFDNYTWNVTAASSKLTNGKILIGDANNVATEQTLSGDISISNTGVASIPGTGTGNIYVRQNSGSLTGTPFTTTPTAGNNSTQIANTTWVQGELNGVIKTTTDQTKTGALTVQGQGNIVANPVLGDLTGTILGVLRGALYGISIGVRGNGNTFIQSQRIDGAATTYNLELQPLSGQVLIGQTASSTYKVDVAGTGRFTGTVVGATATLSTELATLGQVNAKVQNSLTTSTTIAPSADAVNTALALKANLASPTFTGIPLSTTAATGTNTTQIATTAFVTTALTALIKTGTSTQSGNGATLSFNIAHGLGVTPTYFNVNATAAASANISYVTANSTNITVFYTVAPATGTNNLTWNWITK